VSFCGTVTRASHFGTAQKPTAAPCTAHAKAWTRSAIFVFLVPISLILLLYSKLRKSRLQPTEVLVGCDNLVREKTFVVPVKGGGTARRYGVRPE